jgi:hypothetical protein
VRAESIVYKFGDILREKRCLILGDGFYEWKTEGKKKFGKRHEKKTTQIGEAWAASPDLGGVPPGDAERERAGRCSSDDDTPRSVPQFQQFTDGEEKCFQTRIAEA